MKVKVRNGNWAKQKSMKLNPSTTTIERNKQISVCVTPYHMLNSH